MDKLKVYSIGFAQTSAEEFFSSIARKNIKKLIDVRLNNVSQLAGFTKKNDLKYFLNKICGVEYEHFELLAPTKNILDDYKKRKGSWGEYEVRFNELMEIRKIENMLQPDDLDCSCLLCSEKKPHYCHRRLVLEYLNNRWGNILEVQHL